MKIFDEAADYQRYLGLMETESVTCGVRVHGFVLMTTHVHLVVTPPTLKALPAMMQRIAAKYTRYFNRKCDRIGTIWNERYRALLLLDDRYWLTCLRYVEQNPVRAGMTQDPGAYRWTSYRAHAHGESIDWLSPHELYLALASTPEERQRAYRALCGTFLEKPDLAWQRRSATEINAEIRASVAR